MGSGARLELLGKYGWSSSAWCGSKSIAQAILDLVIDAVATTTGIYYYGRRLTAITPEAAEGRCKIGCLPRDIEVESASQNSADPITRGQ
jgi:hypothetical protein